MKHLVTQFIQFQAASTTQSSRDIYAYQLGAFADYFKRMSIIDIKTTDIAAWLDHGRNVLNQKGSTLKSKLMCVKRFFDWCVDQRIVAESPVKLRHLPKIKRNRTDKTPFNLEQHQRVIAELDARPIYYKTFWKPACIIAWHTGLRMSDIANLKNDQINYESDIITVYPRKKESVREKLEIPISAELKAVLESMQSGNDNSPYVLPALHCYYEEYRSTLVSQFREICDNAGLPHHSIHCYRHGFVTRMVNSGASILVVASITGQTLAVLNGYAKISNQTKRSAMEAAL